MIITIISSMGPKNKSGDTTYAIVSNHKKMFNVGMKKPMKKPIKAPITPPIRLNPAICKNPVPKSVKIPKNKAVNPPMINPIIANKKPPITPPCLLMNILILTSY